MPFQSLTQKNETMDTILKAKHLFSSFKNKDNHTSNKEAEQLKYSLVTGGQVKLCIYDSFCLILQNAKSRFLSHILPIQMEYKYLNIDFYL